MLFNAGSLLVVGLIELYFNVLGYRKRTVRPRRAGLRAALLSAVAAGLAFGAILAQSFDLRLAALLGFAALFGAVAGATSGAAYGPPSAVNGGLAGVLAGLAGTVLGSLFFGSGTVVLVTALLFAGCAFLIQRAADRAPAERGSAAAGKARHRAAASQAGRRAKTGAAAAAAAKPSYRGSIVLGAGAVALFAGALLLQDRLQLGGIGQPTSQVAAMDDANDMQVATIDVTGAGFAPKVTEFQANAMIKVVFNVKASAGSGLKIVSKDLNFSADVKPGQNIFLLNNPQPGEYAIEVDGKGKAGTFTVKPAVKL
ncbi:Cupredoxin-like domain-containing protein [Paenibacillus sp. UNC496MF]|nr:Cupredoxin-like domain-containing protein [Paenibacillus sp. UNC496MF]